MTNLTWSLDHPSNYQKIQNIIKGGTAQLTAFKPLANSLTITVIIDTSVESLFLSASFVDQRVTHNFSYSILESQPQFIERILNFITTAINKDYSAPESKLTSEARVFDPINHPDHYTSHPSGIECIDITERYPFNIGNAIKYIWRRKDKGDYLENLKKAGWYISRAIKKNNDKTFIPPDPKDTGIYKVIVKEPWPINYILICLASCSELKEANQELQNLIDNIAKGGHI